MSVLLYQGKGEAIHAVHNDLVYTNIETPSEYKNFEEHAKNLEKDSSYWSSNNHTLSKDDIEAGVTDGSFKLVAVWDGSLHTADNNPGEYKLSKPSEKTTKWINGGA